MGYNWSGSDHSLVIWMLCSVGLYSELVLHQWILLARVFCIWSYWRKSCFERVKTSRVKTNVLQVNLLQSKVVGSQPGIVNLQNDPGIVNGSSKDLAIKKHGERFPWIMVKSLIHIPWANQRNVIPCATRIRTIIEKYVYVQHLILSVARRIIFPAFEAYLSHSLLLDSWINILIILNTFY